MSERTARWLVVLIPLSQPVLIFLLYLRPPSPGRTIALIGVLIVAVAVFVTAGAAAALRMARRRSTRPEL